MRLVGDVDGVIERNTIRRTGGFCILVMTRTDRTGVTNVDILDNDIDECHPVDRVGAILVGAPSVLTLSPEQPITATGIVNIIGNTFRNSSEDCLTSAIAFDTFSGRIERNRFVNFIQPCANPTTRNLPGAIFLGLRGNFACPRSRRRYGSTTSSGTRTPGFTSRPISRSASTRPVISGDRNGARRGTVPATGTSFWPGKARRLPCFYRSPPLLSLARKTAAVDGTEGAAVGST